MGLNQSRIIILLVEDDHETRVSIRSVLEEAGYEVVSATNGMDGLQELAGAHPPNLVLLDWRMPLMNGTDFLRMKMRNDKLAQIPTVIVSGLDFGKIPLGTCAAIKKPFSRDVLLRTVAEYSRKPES